MTAEASAAADPPELAVYRIGDSPGAPAEAAADADERAWAGPLLVENAVWFCHLRWLVVGGLLVAAAVVSVPGLASRLALPDQPAWPAGAAGVLAALNWVFGRLAKRATATGALESIQGVLWAQIVSDLLILTAVIHWLGPAWSAAPFMYLFHIILACVVFPPGQSLAVASLAAAAYGLDLWGTAQGWLPVIASHPVAPAGSGAGMPETMAGRLAPMLLIWVIIWYLVSRLAARLRRREIELAETNRRLAASSEERAHHMLQTTHQLKAPFAAIHAMTQVLLGGYAGELPRAALDVVEKISLRCLALSRQIQEMLQLANLRSRGQSAPQRSPLDLASVLGEAVARAEPAARQRGIRMETALLPTPLLAVLDHITMLVDNLVVNAVNYSYDGGLVEVACAPLAAGGARFTVRDHGIGIPREKLPRIFDDYYRTEEAVRHNRASTGLGLAIVRHAARAERADVEVASAPGWGTRFTVQFPDGPPLTPVLSKSPN